MPLKSRGPAVRPSHQIVDVTDLTGGIDLRRHPTKMREDRAQQLINWKIGEVGALTVRQGYVRHSTSSLGALRPQGGERVYLSSNRHFTLLAYEGKVYKPTDGGAWGSTASSGPPVYSTISESAQVFFPYDRDIVAIMDGANAPVKSTNGSSWTKMGIDPSTSASTLSTGSSGNLLTTATYEVGFTYEDNSLGHESNGGVVSTITMTDTGSLVVEVSGSTDSQVDSINIYVRNVSAGETVRRKASSVANSTDGSTVSVAITSSDWLGNAPEPTDHTVPPLLSFGVAWKNRWWARHATITNRLHFTQVFQPQSWPGTFFLDIPFERGDQITAIQPVGDTLIIFGNTGQFFVIGQTSLDFEVRPALDAQDGALGPRAIARIENGVVHAGASGVYIQDGATDRLLSDDIETGWNDFIDNAAVSDLDRVPLVYHAKNKELRVAVTKLYPTSTPGEWVLDLNRTLPDQVPSWTQTNRTVGGYIHWNGSEQTAGNRGRLFSWSDTAGLIFEESTGTTANSSNMTATYEGPSLAFGLHRARIIETWGEYEPNNGTLTDETVVGGQSQGQIAIDIGSALALYGTATYGTATYGGEGRRVYHRNMPLGSEGRTVSKKLVYAGQSAFKYFTYSYGFVPETRAREHSE